jgi:hypothetical protein
MRDPQPRQVLKRARRIITAALAQRDPDAELLAAAELVCESQPRKPDPDIAVRSPQSPSDGILGPGWTLTPTPREERP